MNEPACWRRGAARAATLIGALALAACASIPSLDTTGVRGDLLPYQLAGTVPPEDAVVLWGGMIVEVHNLADRTEIEVLAYPLDSRQRPRLEQPTEGRFIAVLPGFIDPLLYPQGRFVSLRGPLMANREHAAGPDAKPPLPRVAVQAAQLWPRGFRNSGPRIQLGIGVSL